jgi:hypothetical protein
VRNNPERLAWSILLVASGLCGLLAVGGPLGVRAAVRAATTQQEVTLEVQRGTLRVALEGLGDPIAADHTRHEIPDETVVGTGEGQGRLVARKPGDAGPVVAWIQLYESTEVVLHRARSPLFEVSDLPHEVVLEVTGGRVVVAVVDEDGRPSAAEVRTPHGVATMGQGSYEVVVGEIETEIRVRRGWAEVFEKLVAEGQRIVLREGTIAEVLPAVGNLVFNGGFSEGLEGWTTHTSGQDALQPLPEIEVETVEGTQVVRFHSIAGNAAKAGITQVVDEYIGNETSLELRVDLLIESHTLPVCGTLGSECPVMVRLEYTDGQGVEREWQQGFYSVPNPPGAPEPNPAFCITCSEPFEHDQIPAATWHSFLSGNLIILLSQSNRPPINIRAVTIYASGHAFDTLVAEVELLRGN